MHQSPRAPVLAAAAAAASPPPRAALGPDELAKVVATIDERQRNSGDWKALCYMEAKEKGKTDVVYELVVYRRDEDDKQMFLFTKPRAEAGKGYLRIDKNLWLLRPGGRPLGAAHRARADRRHRHAPRRPRRVPPRGGVRRDVRGATRSSGSTTSTESCWS